MKHFDLICELDIAALPVPPSSCMLWQLATWRQTHPASAHKATETIYYRMPPVVSEHSVFNELSAVWAPPLPDWVRPVVSDLAATLNFEKLGRVMMVNLKPGGHITAHVDEGVYADHYNMRLHLVLAAQHGNVFRCGNEFVMMEPGQLWRFDHKTEHEVWNRSNADRIHLIIDGRKGAA